MAMEDRALGRYQDPFWWARLQSAAWDAAKAGLRLAWAGGQASPWQEAEYAVRIGYGASYHYPDEEWTDDLARRLRSDWETATREPQSWERMRDAVEWGWRASKGIETVESSR